MKILHISKFYPPEPGGIENFAADLAAAQVRQGHEVYVMAHHAAGQFGLPGTIAKNSGVVVEKVRTLAQVAYVPVSPEFFLRMAAVVRNFQPDVIHAHMPNVSAFWLLFIKTGTPVFIHWHADVVASRIDRKMAFFYNLYRPMENLLLKAAHRIICTSNAYLRHSRPLRKWRYKCAVVPLGLDARRLGAPPPEQFFLKQDSGNGRQTCLMPATVNTESRFTVLCVGRFTYYKGFEYLIEAAQKVAMADFVLVGDGPGWASIKNMVSEKGLKDRVQLLGRVDDNRLRGLFAASDLFCLPSIERTEAFGLVLLEAMAFGRPLVTTQIPGSGVTEVNVHGVTGLQVPPADAWALAEAIAALGSDPGLRRRMGNEARLRFENNYEINAVCDMIKY